MQKVIKGVVDRVEDGSFIGANNVKIEGMNLFLFLNENEGKKIFFGKHRNPVLVDEVKELSKGDKVTITCDQEIRGNGTIKIIPVQVEF